MTGIPFFVYLYLFFFLVAPFIVFFGQKITARPLLLPLDFSKVTSGVAERIRQTVLAMQDIGFQPETYLMLAASANVVTYFVMMANRQTGDKAMVTLMTTKVSSEKTAQIGTFYVEFSTRFQDGRMVDTSNTKVISTFIQGPNEIKHRLPTVKDLNRLYQIHRFVIETRIKPTVGNPPLIYPPGQAAEYILDVLERGYEQQAQFGVLTRYEKDGKTMYRPTLKGAFRLAWPMLFPIKQIREYMNGQKEKTLLAEFSTYQPQVTVPR